MICCCSTKSSKWSTLIHVTTFLLVSLCPCVVELAGGGRGIAVTAKGGKGRNLLRPHDPNESNGSWSVVLVVILPVAQMFLMAGIALCVRKCYVHFCRQCCCCRPHANTTSAKRPKKKKRPKSANILTKLWTTKTSRNCAIATNSLPLTSSSCVVIKPTVPNGLPCFNVNCITTTIPSSANGFIPTASAAQPTASQCVNNGYPGRFRVPCLVHPTPNKARISPYITSHPRNSSPPLDALCAHQPYSELSISPPLPRPPPPPKLKHPLNSISHLHVSSNAFLPPNEFTVIDIDCYDDDDDRIVYIKPPCAIHNPPLRVQNRPNSLTSESPSLSFEQQNCSAAATQTSPIF